MKTDQEVITEHYFVGATLENLSVEQLEDFIAQYPHSAAARILLLKKLRDTDPDQYKKQVFSTSLYLSNPLMLSQHLEIPKQESPVASFFVEAAIAENTAAEHPHSADHASESVTQEFEIMEEPESLIPAGEENAETPEALAAPELNDSAEYVEEEKQQKEELQTAAVKEISNDFAFEAFHTVDYFASQGIRLRPSELGKDKLGQQLKSFTDWLRSMKRLPESGPEVAGDEYAQQTISIIAAHSLEEKEVITEAMAQVWAKQGNRQKAIAIYEKLSLQNPSKTPYFAAKIDQLNKF